MCWSLGSEEKKMQTLMEQSQSLHRLLEKVAAVEFWVSLCAGFNKCF